MIETLEERNRRLTLADEFNEACNTEPTAGAPAEPEAWKPDQETIRLVLKKLEFVADDLMGGYRSD